MTNPIHVDQDENIEAKNRLYEIIKKLAEADYREFGATGSDYDKVPHFYFEKDAQEKFKDWLMANQAKIDDKNEDPAMREHLSKFPNLLGALATIFHVVELASVGSKSTCIPIRHVLMAMKLCECLESHARRIYALASNPDLNAALAMKEKLTEGSIKPLRNGFTARDVFRRNWTGLENYRLITSALARLEEAHWIRGVKCDTADTGGRPTIRYEINPKIAG